MMDINDVKEYLPHRYPLLLVDRVLEIVEGESLTAYKNVSINEEIFNAHFPQKPIFPGVMIIEALAQAAGILGLKTLNKKTTDGAMYVFAGADKVRFRRQVVPGDQLMLRVHVVSTRHAVWKFKCEASVDGELAASATLLCADQQGCLRYRR